MHYAIDATRNDLKSALTSIRDFANKQNLNSWAKVFNTAINTLNAEQPNTNYYCKDLILTKNYSLNARQLLFAAADAWVFGGMGSWNDIGFENEELNKLYSDLSEKLYKMIIHSIIAVTNTEIRF